LTPVHIAVVGGGYTGTLQAIELLNRGARVTLVERGPRFARGAAYGTEHPDHLLNVRAAGMSAFADRPRHFAEWVERETGAGPGDFAQRRVYGRYLEEMFAAAGEEAGGRLRAVEGEVISIQPVGAREVLRLAGGGAIEADAAILAVGNLPPEPTRGIVPERLPVGTYIDDPWAADFIAGLQANDAVLLIGTGLTAVDAALMLESAGFRGRTIALSRRGLLPRAHADTAVAPLPPEEGLEPRCTILLRAVRGSEGGEWRARVDSLRPVTQQLWRAAAPAERRRFLRHLRPWWDVHRHRIAPAVAARIGRLRRDGRLTVGAGRILEAGPDGEGAMVRWRPRGSAEPASLRVRRIVNCTGPQADIARAGEPLLDALLAAGRIRPDACRIGIDVDESCRVLSTDGAACDSLHAVGPMTRGAFWEIVAVPDIRIQVRDLADRIVRRRS
jgi:uncharacterized NAD(P)/FAD-binding protein YdhS